MSESAPYRYFYNPRRAAPEELERAFVGRRRLFDDLVEHVRRHARAKSLQHILLIGPRGSGKSHLVTMLCNRVAASDLRGAWRPVQLAEEEWKVDSLHELLLAIFTAMMRQEDERDVDAQLPGHLQPRTVVETLRLCEDRKSGADLGLDLLAELVKTTGRRCLLAVENLDAVLGDMSDDATGIKRLRSELMNRTDILLVATSPAEVSALLDTDNPLFGLLRPIRLNDLSVPDMEDLLRRRGLIEAAADPEGPARAFLNRLDSAPQRLRALLHLAGGNPRTALMLYQVAVHAEIEHTHAGIGALLDELTPYFQQRLKELPPLERKVVLALAESGRAMRPSELGRSVRIPAAQASTCIGRLVDRGYLRLAEQEDRKGRYYVLQEVLLRYWYLWRTNHRDFTMLVEFLAAWFLREELERWVVRRE